MDDLEAMAALHEASSADFFAFARIINPGVAQSRFSSIWDAVKGQSAVEQPGVILIALASRREGATIH